MSFNFSSINSLNKVGSTLLFSFCFHGSFSNQVLHEAGESSGSAQELSKNIPKDSVVEILTRLPVKSLARFKCVSKPWLSLISSPFFIKSHLKSAITVTNAKYLFNHHLFCISTNPHNHYKDFTQHLLLGGAQNDDLVTLNYNIPNVDIPVRILGSCNGLICIFINEAQLLIWNPIFENFKIVPRVHQNTSMCYLKDGFGYDPISDDYKILSIFYYMGNSLPYRVLLYSRRTDSWKRIEDFKYGNPLDQTAKYARGKFHWLIDFNGCPEIVTFDLASESFGKVGGPNPDALVKSCSTWEYNDLCATLGLFSDNLCLLYDDHETKMDLWLMEEYGNNDSWVRLFTLPVLGPPGLFPHTLRLIWVNDDEVLFYYGSVFIVFNLKETTHRLVRTDTSISQGEVLVESLILPGDGGP